MGTPEMYKLNVGDIVDVTYAGLGFNGKVCRVEALELQSNGLVAVSLIEYFDVYTWEVPPQEPVEELANLPSAFAVKAPTGLSFTDSNASSTNRPFLSWDEPTDFPDHEYRINVVDSSSNELTNKIVDTEFCDLGFIPVGSNYVASVSSINTLGVESSPATLTFSVATAPVDTADVKDDAITLSKAAADLVAAIDAGGAGSTQLIKSTSAPSTRDDGNALQAQDLWADTDDNNQIYVRNASNNDWVKARDSSLVTLYNSLSSTVSTNSSNIATAQGDIVTLTTDTSANASAISSLTSTVNSNTSAISTEQTTRANADSALAADITSLTSTVNSNTSSISSEATTRANADAALASDITSLTSTVGGNTSSISTNASAISTINGNAAASYVLKLNANGKVAQMVLESNASSGTGATSTIAFLADTFKIDNNAGSSVSPFIVSGGQVFIDNARITNLSGTKIDVDTLNVKHFDDVSADIINQTGGTVPLRVQAKNQDWSGSLVGSTINSVEGIYMNTTTPNIRNGATYQVVYSAVLGQTRVGTIEYSYNQSTWVSLGGVGNSSTSINTGAGSAYRTYVFIWQGTLSGMTSSQETVYWRVNWNNSGSQLNTTYQSIYIDIDNTT
jgi:hypothetical protein